MLKDWRGAAVVRFMEYGNEEEVKFEQLSKLTRTKKRKGPGYEKHRPKMKRRKGREERGAEGVWSREVEQE
jgi:hypothetical protein